MVRTMQQQARHLTRWVKLHGKRRESLWERFGRAVERRPLFWLGLWLVAAFVVAYCVGV